MGLGGSKFPPFTLVRVGGNRYSAYNWETNFSNAGNDFQYENDDYLTNSREPGEAVRTRIEPFRAKGAAALVTIPMMGYVAADDSGPTDVTDLERASRLAMRFKVSRPSKGAPFALPPDVNDQFVYQDEFVDWIDHTFPGGIADRSKPIMFSLDNEPDLWSSTHEEIFTRHAGGPRLQTYDDFTNTSIEYARAVKHVAPAALVWGPAVANYAGMALLGRTRLPIRSTAPSISLISISISSGEPPRKDRVCSTCSMCTGIPKCRPRASASPKRVIRSSVP